MTSRFPRTALRRTAAGLGAAGLALLGLAAPAHAEGVELTLGSNPAEAALYPYPASGERQFSDFDVWVDAAANTDSQVQYTVDLSGLAGVADWKNGIDGLGSGCEAAGAVVTCEDWGTWEGRNEVARLRLAGAQGAADGASGTVKVTAGIRDSVDDPYTTVDEYTAKVSIGGPDLVAKPLPAPGKVKPGDVYQAPLVFANAGSQPVDGVLLTMRATHGVEFVDRYENCEYSTSESQFAGPGSVVICAIDETVAAGEVWQADPAERLKLAGHAWNDEFLFQVSADTAEARAKARGGLSFSAGDGRTLGIRRSAGTRSADLDPWNNMAETAFQVANHADLAAKGVAAKGGKGAKVTVDLGWQNRGPAWIGYIRSGESVAQYEFLVPRGAKVTKVARGCVATKKDGGWLEDGKQPGAPRYVCTTGSVILEDQVFSYPFELEIQDVVENATGKLTVGVWQPGDTPKPHDFDNARQNNSAALVLNGTGGSSTGGSGDGGTDGGGSTTGGGDGGSSTGGGTAQSAGGSAGDDGDLASTGADGVVLIGGSAVAAVGLGAVLYVAMRRRRQSGGGAAA
ncbi:peptidase [Streptomyces polyrhachis]|uniref:Peptidase n=1 Tax=Streptomyces polyrhachis TaxID=1282885 RepID=A0ABW2GJ84_9ACTN